MTFNYDLSLEYYLLQAFAATYALSTEGALDLFNQTVEVIHVYGQLDTIWQLGGGGHEYGGKLEFRDQVEVGKKIKIIGRDPQAPEFVRAQEVIRSADYVGILGFGYDDTNVANLALAETLQGKAVFSTGYDLGYGMRAKVRHAVGPLLIGSPRHKVGTFLRKSGFLHWANTPRLRGELLMDRLRKYGDGSLREFHVMDY